MVIRSMPGRHAQVDDTLIYKERPDQKPMNPEDLWHGIVKVILVDVADKHQERYYIVHSIEWLGEVQIVFPSQAVSFESKDTVYN